MFSVAVGFCFFFVLGLFCAESESNQAKFLDYLLQGYQVQIALQNKEERI